MKRVIGLMSGTSLDGVDAALLETDGTRICAYGPTAAHTYSLEEKRILQDAVARALKWGFDGDAPDFAEAAALIAHRHADTVKILLSEAGLQNTDIDLIGFHGQTVLHRAPDKGVKGQTCQIGDAECLASITGIDVIHDFRTADMEAGGQGAPLATLYHQALAREAGLSGRIAVVNLGGVANVTWLDGDADPVAFDTGPASGLLDAWCEERVSRTMDRDGELARAGLIDDTVLAEMMAHPFFKQSPPKSLDRWDFSFDPVQSLSTEDGAATLTAFSAHTLADAIKCLGKPDRVLVTGGGRNNPVMMEMIGCALGQVVEPVEAVGWRGDHIEAEAFAWLAARVDAGLPTSLPSTTGAREAVSGGKTVRN